MRKTDHALRSRRCAFVAAGLGLLWVGLVTRSAPLDGGFKIFCNVLLAVAVLTGVLALVFRGVVQAHGKEPKDWRNLKRIVFWALPVLAFALVCVDVPLCRGLGGLFALAWTVWAVLALFVCLVAFTASCVAKKKSLEG